MTRNRYLILNGNTNTAMTQSMVRLAADWFGDDGEVRGLSAASGYPYINTREHCVAACDAVQELLQQPIADVDLAIVGCFGLPDIERLRASAPYPLIDMLESGVRAARQLSDRFVILTAGQQWPGMLHQELERRGLMGGCIGIRALDQLALDPLSERDALIETMADQVKEAVEALQPGAVLIGGAAFAGIGTELQAQFEIPVIDSFQATLALAETLLSMQHAGIDWQEGFRSPRPGRDRKVDGTI
ncbi:aspartate/glutamate racemase family protein [Marinobacterium aestuariivivens]|uniref:Aspartate/glutamate racemase family protein n=1 Tax=Marinobacterium aestuariivivens TaxID=1698799 RepID=A0ABW2A2W2_9GAMM